MIIELVLVGALIFLFSFIIGFILGAKSID